MKILITGGAGFIGSNIANYYLKKGRSVAIYDNLSRKGTEKNIAWIKKIYPKVTFHQSDIRDFNNIKRSMSDVGVVFHMASQVAVTTSVKEPRTDFEVNALGTLNVLEAARKLKKPPIIIYASTNKVYGNLEKIKIKELKKRYEFQSKEYQDGVNENTQLDFHSPYGCSKGCGDQYVRDYARIYGLKTIVFRQSCIYGQRQFGNEDQGWVAHFAIQSLKKKPITIYGNGKQVRDILHIDDLIKCYEKSIQQRKLTGGRIYNIGGGKMNSVSLIELIDLLEEKLLTSVKIRKNSWRPGDQKIYISDNAKAKKDFNWTPKTSVDKGLDKLLTWLKIST